MVTGVDMEIVVCIKQVPDAPSVRVDAQRMTIIREGVESIINPLDRIALEAALELREAQGGRITAISMGPPQSEAALREAMAAGADRAVLLSDPGFAGADTLATSHVLATAIQRLDVFPDLILCGMQTVDSDTGHVGPQIAEELDLPQACGVEAIRCEGHSLVVKRRADGFQETLELSLPALVTVAHGLRQTQEIPLGRLERAFSERQFMRWGREDLGLAQHEVGLPGSATRVWRLHAPQERGGGEILQGPPELLVERLVQELQLLNLVEDDDDF